MCVLCCRTCTNSLDKIKMDFWVSHLFISRSFDSHYYPFHSGHSAYRLSTSGFCHVSHGLSPIPLDDGHGTYTHPLHTLRIAMDTVWCVVSHYTTPFVCRLALAPAIININGYFCLSTDRIKLPAVEINFCHLYVIRGRRLYLQNGPLSVRSSAIIWSDAMATENRE